MAGPDRTRRSEPLMREGPGGDLSRCLEKLERVSCGPDSPRGFMPDPDPRPSSPGQSPVFRPNSLDPAPLGRPGRDLGDWVLGLDPPE